jgi:hypothetical protein
VRRKKKRRGHYCWACGRVLANERFSGSGHATHVCRECRSELRRQRRAVRSKFQVVLENLKGNGSAPAGPLSACEWSVADVDAHSRRFDVRLTFRAGAEYCCFEPGCHLSLHRAESWERLREMCSRNGIDLSDDPLVLVLQCTIEAGASCQWASCSESYRCSATFREPARRPG